MVFFASAQYSGSDRVWLLTLLKPESREAGGNPLTFAPKNPEHLWTLSKFALVDGDATGATFQIGKKAEVTGELLIATEPVELLPVEVPDGLEDLGSIAFSGNETLTLGPGSYRASELLLGNLSTLHIDNAAGPVTLYVTGPVEVTGQADITTSDADPEKFAVYVADSATVTLLTHSTFYGVIYAPEASIVIDNQGELFGAFVGSSVELSNHAQVHYDTALRGE